MNTTIFTHEHRFSPTIIGVHIFINSHFGNIFFPEERIDDFENFEERRTIPKCTNIVHGRQILMDSDSPPKPVAHNRFDTFNWDGKFMVV